MRPVAPTRSRVVSLKGSVGCRPIQADYDEGFAAPDIFGPYGWEDANNPGTGLTFPDQADQLTIPAADAFLGTYSAKFHYAITDVAVGNQDSNRRVVFDATAYNLEHFFVRAYVKFDSATLDWTTVEAISRKLFYFKSDPTNNNTWFIVLGVFDLEYLNGSYADPTSTPPIALTNFTGQDPMYTFPLDVYRGLEVEVQLNTAGNSDGYVTIWIYNPDGTTITTKTFSGLKIRGDGHTDKLRNVEIGNQANRTQTGVAVDEYRWWDQVAISRRRIGPVVGAGASGYTAWDPGVNFRSTLAFVTDPAGTTFVQPVYATESRISRGVSVTHGESAGAWSAEDLSAVVDARLAGTIFRSHAQGAGLASYTVNLKAPLGGTYDIRLALGGVGVTNFPYIEVRDGVSGSVLFTISDVNGCASGQFYDANGVIRTSAADWVTNNTSRSITLTGSTLVINAKYLSPLGSGRNAISHLRLTRTG